jgi:hypothetical protein
MANWTTIRKTQHKCTNVIFFVEKVHYVIRWINATFYVQHMEFLSQHKQRPCHHYGQDHVILKAWQKKSSVSIEETYWGQLLCKTSLI